MLSFFETPSVSVGSLNKCSAVVKIKEKQKIFKSLALEFASNQKPQEMKTPN